MIVSASWPIESRVATHEGRLLLYVIGLNKSPMEVRLKGAGKIRGWKDLISGETGRGATLKVEPLDVRLLVLEK